MSSWLAGSSADISHFHILLEPAHTILAKTSLGVLLRLDEHVDAYSFDNNFPLARYAAEHWVEHAQFEKVTSHIRDEMDHLFNSNKPYFAAWLQIYDIDTCPPFPSALHDFLVRGKKSNTGNPLYYAALCGFHDLAKRLITKDPHQVNANGGYFASPLRAALGREHLAIAQLLYKLGPDVGVQGHIKTPLNVAPSPGRSEIVEWLLSHGADPNHRGNGDPYTSLHAAAYCGHDEVCRMLLQHKADQNALDNSDGRTSLHLASRQGHTDIAQLLLEHGVDLNARDLGQCTALHLASEKGHIDVVRLLVEYGADVNARSMVWL
jgi:ankyrin repeat protein